MDISFKDFGKDTDTQIQAIFSSIFILQNKLQTACDKLQKDITMKQWLLLAMTTSCQKPPTLTRLGELMGCSRQNVKKLALALEKKGFLHIKPNENNASATCIILDGKIKEYIQQNNEIHIETLSLLFRDFTTQEIEQLYKYVEKLFEGISRVEAYSKGVNENAKEKEM